MSLVKGTVNAMNLLSVRKLKYIPEHFARMQIKKYNADSINSWIYKNLDSRYAIVSGLALDKDDRLIEIQELGIEDPKELTMLCLLCPYIKDN